MKPRFRRTRRADVETLGQDVEALADDLGELAGAVLLGRFTIGTSETKIAHNQGAPPRWDLYSKEGIGDVYQTQPPDKVWLYLASSVEVTTGVLVF